MSIESRPSELVPTTPSEFGYFGKTGVFYDDEGLPDGSTEDSSFQDTLPLRPLRNPSLKLLWLIVSSMVAVQEGNCQFCPSHNGLYPNVGNCKCYFKCIDGVPIQKWCPPGQKFDVMSMSCTFPSKTVCAGSLVHLFPSVISKYQNQGGNNNAMPPQQQMMQQQGPNGNLHITLAVAKPNYNNGGNGGGNGGDMQGNMMQMMQMIMMMMQNQKQGMNNNMNQQNNQYQNMMMGNQQNIMNSYSNMNQNMNQNMMDPNMMNQNMNQQNGKYQNMMNQNMMNQNMMDPNMMNQNMMNQNMMNQNMNQQNGKYQNMMNQNMMNQNMMNQNMNQNMMPQGGGQQPQCSGTCHKSKKHVTIVYDLNLNKFPIKFKLFG